MSHSRLVLSLACALSFAFATAAHATLIHPVSVEASSTWDNRPSGWVEVESVIDGRGITGPVTAASLHSNGYPQGGSLYYHWHTAQHAMGDPSGEWIAFDLGGHYNLTSLVVWNYNTEATGGSLTARGFKDFDIRVSTNDTFGDGDDVLLTGFIMNQAQAFGAAGSIPSQIIGFNATNVRYVRLEPLTNYGDTYTGLGEVRFEGSLVPEPASLALIGAGALLTLRRRRSFR